MDMTALIFEGSYVLIDQETHIISHPPLLRALAKDRLQLAGWQQVTVTFRE